MNYSTKAVSCGIGIACCLCLSGCASTESDHYNDKSRKIHDAFSQICYDQTYEWIKRRAGEVTALSVSPPSNAKSEWGGDAFYSAAGYPKSWGGLPTTLIQTRESGVQQIPSSTYSESTERAIEAKPTAPVIKKGSFALRYKYIPEERTIEGDVWKFHGVKQQVVDLATEEVIAERSNYLIGGDFNRSFFCLGANWYRGNDGFADRVLGNRYIEEKTGKRYPDPKPEIYLKSILTRTEDVTTKGVINRYENALPAGSIHDYNNRVIILPEGEFYMPSYWNQEPIPIVGTIEKSDRYVFVMTPDSWMRSEPIRQLLFMYRMKNGDLIKSVYVQIPPGIEWVNGWGINPSEITITDSEITFSLLGRKKSERYITPTVNNGTYLRRYTYSASIPEQQP